MGQFCVVPRTVEATPQVSWLVEDVGIGVFDAACRSQVVVGDWESVGVRVVDGGGVGDHGLGLFQGGGGG